MFESVEEVDQIETEPKSEEAKQAPKMPNGAFQNGTSSPDSGHPSSRNFSVTSGLSDGSLSTEDSAAPDATQRSTVVPHVLHSPVKPQEEAVESSGLTEEPDMQVKGELKGKEEVEEEKVPDEGKSAENTKTGVRDDNIIQPMKETNKKTSLQPKTDEADPENVNMGLTNCEDGGPAALGDIKGKEVTNQDNIMVSEVPAESKGELGEQSLKKEEDVSIEETSKVKKTGETNVEKGESNGKVKGNNTERLKFEDTEKSKTGVTAGTEEQAPRASQVEKSLLFSPEIRTSREAYCASQKDEAPVMTESDESPSAIEMEEIPKAKFSMVPWSRKGRCEPSSSLEDSAPHMGLRPEEVHEKLSPEGTESILSEEPEMESLYPHFDSLARPGETKNELTSQESTGNAFSVSASLIYFNLYTFHTKKLKKNAPNPQKKT